jgi:hypothetical protein
MRTASSRAVRLAAMWDEYMRACRKGRVSDARRAISKLETLLPTPGVELRGDNFIREGDTPSAFEMMELSFIQTWGWTVDIRLRPWLQHAWLCAVIRRDNPSLCLLFAIAKRGWTNPPHAHMQRTFVLMLKDVLEARTKLQGVPATLEISRLADMLSYPKPDKADGFASLRRFAKRLGFPLALAKRGPKFKTPEF